MILDGLLVFSSAQALTSTADSTNVLDLTNARDLGQGNDSPAVKLMLQVGTAFQSTGSSTLVVSLAGSTDNSTYTTMVSIPSIAKAAMIAGAVIGNIDLPRRVNGQALPRYLKLVYTVGTADFTAGTLNAALVLDRQDNTYYPVGQVVQN